MVAVTNAFTATGNGGAFQPAVSEARTAKHFNISAYGTFVGTVVLEKTYDGTNYIPVIRPSTGTAISYTAPGTEVLCEPEVSVSYRWRCSAYTSGTINARLSN